jgi:hypothetical protein
LGSKVDEVKRIVSRGGKLSKSEPEVREVKARMALALKWMETEVNSGWFPDWNKVRTHPS